MTCTILEITQPAPRNDGPDFPPDLCNFCNLPFDGCHCDEPIELNITDFGRTNANETPLIRQAHRQAAWNGNGSICRVLEGIHPALKDALTEDTCPTCGSDTPDFCDCDPEPTPMKATGETFGPSTWDADEVKNFFDKRFEN